jgi:hypothetical protein
MNAISDVCGYTPALTGETAIVTACSGDRVTLNRGGAMARLAVSCLVQPAPGDLVLLAATEQGVWVQAVLDWAEPRALRLSAPAGLDIGASRIGLAAEAISLDTQSLTASAEEAHVSIGSLLHIGRQVVSHARRVCLIGQRIETIVAEAVLRARHSLRLLTETEHVQSRDIAHHASGSFSLQAEHAVLAAEQIVKIDADQIHMG